MFVATLIVGFLAAGIVESKGIVKRDAESVAHLKTRLCEMLTGLGEYSYHAHCVVFYSRRVGNLTLDHARSLAADCLANAHACCAQGAADDCFQAKTSTVHDKICSQMAEAHDDAVLKKCCPLSGMGRYSCLHDSETEAFHDGHFGEDHGHHGHDHDHDHHDHDHHDHDHDHDHHGHGDHDHHDHDHDHHGHGDHDHHGDHGDHDHHHHHHPTHQTPAHDGQQQHHHGDHDHHHHHHSLPHDFDAKKICLEHAEDNEKLYDRLLWEFSRRFPSTSGHQIVILVNGFISGVTQCCLVEEEHETCLYSLRETFRHKLSVAASVHQNMCDALKTGGKEKFEDMMVVTFTHKLPTATLAQIQKLAHGMEVAVEKCCLLEHKENCFTTESTSLVAELCSHVELVRSSARLALCCKQPAAVMGDCFSTHRADESEHREAHVAAPDLEHQCALLADKPHDLHVELLWALTLSHPTGDVDFLRDEALSAKSLVATCCAKEDKKSCPEMEASKKEFAKLEMKSEPLCKMSDNVGPMHFSLLVIIQMSQRFPHATFEEIEDFSVHFLHETERCCAHNVTQGCALQAHHGVYEALCHGRHAMSRRPEVRLCCAMAETRARGLCLLAAAGGDANVTSSPLEGEGAELCSRELCRKHRDTELRFYKRAAWGFGRTFTNATMTEMRSLITKYIMFVDKCCHEIENFKEDVKEIQIQAHHACHQAEHMGEEKFSDRLFVQLTQRYPGLPFVNTTLMSKQLAHAIKKCCHDTDNPMCLLEEEFSIATRLCCDQATALHVPALERCCRMPAHHRSECFLRDAYGRAAPPAAPPAALPHAPTPEVECGEGVDPHSLDQRVMFELSKHFQTLPPTRIQSLGHHYIEQRGLCCAKPAEERAGCLAQARGHARHEAEREVHKVQRICQQLKTYGADKYEDSLIITLSQKAPKATFDQIRRLGQRLVAGASRCCEHSEIGSCFMGHNREILDSICASSPSSLPPSVIACCSTSSSTSASSSTSHEDARDACFASLSINASHIPHIPYYSNSRLCSLRSQSHHKFLDRFLWEFSRRHVHAAHGSIEEAAERFVAMSDSCCGKIDSDACFAKERADIRMKMKAFHSEHHKACGSLHVRGEEMIVQRNIILLAQKAHKVSFEKVSEMAHHLLHRTQKCCASDHEAECFSEEHHTIEDELCSEHSDDAKVSACCQLMAADRSRCLDRESHAEGMKGGEGISEHGEGMEGGEGKGAQGIGSAVPEHGEAVCAEMSGNATQFAERIFYEFGRRLTDASIPEVEKFAQSCLKSVAECCATDKSQDCLIEKRAALDATIKGELAKAHGVCERLHKEGGHHFEELVMIHYTQKAHTLPFDEVEEFADSFVHLATECCSGRHEPHCLLDETLHLADELCSDSSYMKAHPGAVACCKSAVSQQESCFQQHEQQHRTDDAAVAAAAAAAAAATPPTKVCLRYKQFPEKFLHLALYSFARQFPTEEASVLRHKADDYTALVKSCCFSADIAACFAEKIKEIH